MIIAPAKTDAEIRKAVKTIFGARNAIVKKNGEIHVRGHMPNSTRYGWYFFGFTGDAHIDERLFYPDGSLVMSAS